MKKEHKVLFGKECREVRRILCKPMKARAVMDHLLPKPKGYTGI